MNEPRSDDEWIDFYVDQRGIYDAFVQNLRDLVRDLLIEDDVDYSWVISFSCDPDDMAWGLNRARRNGETIDNPLESSLRVAGVSIGILSPTQAPLVGDLVRREFVVDPAGTRAVEDADTSHDLHYPHYLVSLDQRRLELDEWSRFAELKVRIEVKTLLQDCWEQIDEELPFYVATSYPAEVRDLVTRSALALSAIDADLAEANRALWRLLAEYEETIATGDLQLSLNGVSLRAYIYTSELVRSLTEVAVDVGFEAYPDYEPSWQAIEPGILWLLRVDDLHTLAELEDFLKQATPRARDTLAELARNA